MGTEVLRPQDCLIERIRDSPCRRRNFHGTSSFYPNCSSYNSNPRFNRKQTVRSDRSEPRKRQAEPSISKRSSSADDVRAGRMNKHPNGGNHHNHHHHNNNQPSLVMEKVTILRRGESLDSKIKSTGEMVVTGTDRLGPEPEMVPKQVRMVDLSSPLAGKSDMYAGSAFFMSPAPSSLPLPSFSKRKQVSVDDLATRDLRRLLRLEF
ncbi:hypothetical protein K2173_022332 [Erythroxylum novogranatense]|uniref:Uncharacterized protein n=1 Tax=Erythroxylum novogranatense TaxID=1862640 RepID=A0AAV8THP0_9ROSI|nr:hypothetical protein K2173_022332 [Erythroxylum novogranatense]